jgi:predicted DNA-binding transcriptional regulator YafY
MSKKQFLKRYILIIGKLRKKPASFEEIDRYLQLQSEIDGENYVISKRTFQRDLQEIQSLYNIVILFNRSENTYEITEDANEERNERLIESFELYSALNVSDNLSRDIIFEKRRPLGTENLHGILHAIKNKLQIAFKYEKYLGENNGIEARNVSPLALKESRYRWYLIALDKKDGHIKSFGLDRISDLEISSIKFNPTENEKVDSLFKYSFGVTNDPGIPEKIILSLSPEQGKYIKSLPLHVSQKELVNNNNEYRIELTIHPTYDFIMEILSLGREVKVIKPESLQLEIIKILKDSLESYTSEN